MSVRLYPVQKTDMPRVGYRVRVNGAEEISDVIFEDCHIIHVTGPVLDCCNVDYADVHNVTYRNIFVEMDEVIPVQRVQALDDAPYEGGDPGYAPPPILAEVLFHPEYSAGGQRRGINRDLLYEDIAVRGGKMPLIVFSGYSESAPCRNLTVRRLTLDGRPLSAEEIRRDIRDFCENITVE